MCRTCRDLMNKRDRAKTADARAMYQTMLDGHQNTTCHEHRRDAGIREAMDRARAERKGRGLFQPGNRN